MGTLTRDLRYAVRMMWRNPGFTAAAALTLALGIGANSAIFSLVNAVLLRPLPYGNVDRLSMIWGGDRSRGMEPEPVTPADFAEWRADGRFFEQMAGSRDATYSLTGKGDPESIFGYRFSADFFSVLGVMPALGRTFLVEEDRPGANRVVVLSHALWMRRFGGDAGILGEAIMLNGEPYTVIGVMPPGFQHPQSAELWTPLAMDPSLQENRDRKFLRVAARLKPGVTQQQAQAGIDEIMRRREGQFPDSNTGRTGRVVMMRDEFVGDIKPALLMLLGAVGFVLLMACANVANLALARSVGRSKELAIRAALGAGRTRLIRQLLTESVLLSSVGGALGLILAMWCSSLLVTIFPNNIANLDIPIIKEIPIDWTVVGFTTLVTMLTGLLFGLAPALQATKPDVNDTLNETPRGATTGASSRRARNLLIIVETAMAVVLLAGAGLMFRSFLRLQQGDLGLEPRGIMTGQVFLAQTRYPDLDKRRLFVDTVLQRLEGIPGVESAGVTNFLPLSGFWGTIQMAIDGQPAPRPGEEPEADDRLVSAGYFKTMGIRLLAGREFTPRDREGAPQVAIINDTMARKYWAGEDPIGRRVNLGDAKEPRFCEIIGVVRDVKSFGLDQATHTEFFRPVAQVPFPLLAFTVRTSADPLRLADPLRRAIWEVDKDQPVFKVLSMQQLANESLTLRRVSMLLLLAFAVMAIGLAAIGIYGVISYSVSQRTNEIGIRMALGADPGDVAGLIVKQGMRPMLIGLAIGLPVALGLTRLIMGLLYGMSPSDPATYGAAVLLLVAVGLVACYLPARRATRIDPVAALRQG